MSDFFFFLDFLCPPEKDNGCLKSTRFCGRADVLCLFTLFKLTACTWMWTWISLWGPLKKLEGKASGSTCVMWKDIYQGRDPGVACSWGRWLKSQNPHIMDFRTRACDTPRNTREALCDRSQASSWVRCLLSREHESHSIYHWGGQRNPDSKIIFSFEIPGVPSQSVFPLHLRSSNWYIFKSFFHPRPITREAW